jgi:Fe-S cluster biosynthesis and repair protein YggX
MTRKVQCQLLGEELDGLAFQPYPGDLGKRIYENISQQGWQRWLAHQTMLINENRLSPINPEHRKFLETEMEKFFFGEGSEAPEGYVPPDE